MGKPLISDAQILAIYGAMQRLREAQQSAPRRSALNRSTSAAWPIAVLAASLLQLTTEDVLVVEGDADWARGVLTFAQEPSFHPDRLPVTISSSDRAGIAALAAGYALAQNHYSHPGDSAPVTFALLQAGTPVQEAMRIAGEHRLPLILLVREEPNRPRLPMAAPENVEVIQIDAEDAVAICRVMQESIVRTRNRWGSVVLRAVTLPGSKDAISALEEHLAPRGLQK